MTTQIKDLPEKLNNTVATRLRLARDNAGLTRNQVTTETGIPVKSIEKFENGNQEPSVSRLVTLAKLYDVPVVFILGQGDDQVVNEQRETGQGTTVASVEGLASIEKPVAILGELDAMRAHSFVLAKRRPMALVNELLRQLNYLEPDELLEIASSRGLYEDECPDNETLLGFFFDDPNEGQKYCGLIEERIIDTAVLGVDLFSIELDALKHWAEDFNVVSEEYDCMFYEWKGHADLVQAIRPPLRSMAFSGNSHNFDELEDGQWRQ